MAQQVEPATRYGSPIPHPNPVTPRRRHPGSLETRRTGSDDEDAPWLWGLVILRVWAPFRFPAGGWVDDTRDGETFGEKPGTALITADTGSRRG